MNLKLKEFGIARNGKVSFKAANKKNINILKDLQKRRCFKNRKDKLGKKQIVLWFYIETESNFISNKLQEGLKYHLEDR